jgi:hypothetical protein
MNLTRLGGYALCLSALINVLQFAWYSVGGADPVPVMVVGLVGGILLIAGLLACWPIIREIQPQTGRAGQLGQLGLALMGIGALVSLGLNLYFMLGGSGIADVVPFAGAFIGLAGNLLVGSVTVQTGVFPVWAGWMLIAGGLLNFVGGLIATGMLASLVGLASVLATSIALIGFGLHIVRKPEQMVTREEQARV